MYTVAETEQAPDYRVSRRVGYALTLKTAPAFSFGIKKDYTPSKFSEKWTQRVATKPGPAEDSSMLLPLQASQLASYQLANTQAPLPCYDR
jgi:hypothetical protein